MTAWEWAPFDGDSSVATTSRRYEWDYGGEGFDWEIDIPETVYDVHRRRPRVYDYGTYVADGLTQDLLAGLCDGIEARADDWGLDRRERATFVTRFVQSLPYTPDDVSTDFINYPRYPVETLVDETGDCEDASLLLAALLFGLNYDVAIARFDDHLGVVVALEDAPGNVELDGREYSYIESTGRGWDVGQLPSSCEGRRVRFVRVSDSPALYGKWRVEAGDDGISGRGTVTNRGLRAAEDVRFQVTLDTEAGRTVAGAGGNWDRIEPGETVEWSTAGAVDAEARTELWPGWFLTDEARTHDFGKGPQKTL